MLTTEKRLWYEKIFSKVQWMDEYIPNSACPAKHDMCEGSDAALLRDVSFTRCVSAAKFPGVNSWCSPTLCRCSVAVSRLMCCHIALHGEQGAAFSYKSFLIFPSPSEAFSSLFDLSFWCMYSTRWPDANAMGMVQIKMIIWKWPKFSNNWQFPTPPVPECCETIHPCRGQYLRVSS